MIKEYFIGTSGWNYSHWKEIFYPKGLSQKRWFEFYTDNFDTVEINYSFYRWPTEETIKNWYERSPNKFKFTLKAPRTITHVKKFNDVGKWVRDLYKLTNLLKEKTACHLFQAPPQMKFNEESFKKLERFFKTLDPEKKNVIEFRHEDWWNNNVYDLCKKHNVIFCIVSGLGMPDDIVVTSDICYFRFHGEGYSTRYSKRVLEAYANVMKKINCKVIYAYFNNDANAYAPHNAEELKSFF